MKKFLFIVVVFSFSIFLCCSSDQQKEKHELEFVSQDTFVQSFVEKLVSCDMEKLTLIDTQSAIIVIYNSGDDVYKVFADKGGLSVEKNDDIESRFVYFVGQKE